MVVSVFLTMPSAVFAAASPEWLTANLERVYWNRADLRQVFRPDDWTAVPSPRTKGMADLEDWARQYGYKEHPDLLAGYGPAGLTSTAAPPPSALPPALRTRRTMLEPVLKDGSRFDFSRVSAAAVFVADVPSREVLLARNSRKPWPLASITKLMTAAVALDQKLSFSRTQTLTQDDEVGGARLRVPVGSRLSTADLFYSMIVGSANNAAHAVSRSTGLSYEEFVATMNVKAGQMGLASTRFVDPTGLEPSNVSTAQEVAALGLELFEKYYYIRKSASTATYEVMAAGQPHRITNTNDLLTDDDNGLIVTGGKTGYLEESKWNLVVRLQDGHYKPLIVVVLGSDSQQQVFRDAETAARWVWDNYRWVVRN